MRVLVFGDSITYGAWDRRGGWVDRLKAGAHQFTLKDQANNKLQVINLGIGGDTSAKVLARLEQEIAARYSASWEFVFVFAVGTNDTRLIDGKPEVELQQFEENIRKIVAVARNHTDKIVFLGLPPLGAEDVDFKKFQYCDTDVATYDAALRALLGAENVVYIPMRANFGDSKQQYFTDDNLHPNDEGHQLILKKVLPEIEKICGVTL